MTKQPYSEWLYPIPVPAGIGVIEAARLIVVSTAVTEIYIENGDLHLELMLDDEKIVKTKTGLTYFHSEGEVYLEPRNEFDKVIEWLETRKPYPFDFEHHLMALEYELFKASRYFLPHSKWFSTKEAHDRYARQLSLICTGK